jgi:nuclear pore complex protein Nup93
LVWKHELTRVDCSQAVAFLHQHSQYQADAVHFAIALCYYGLLRIPARSKSSEVDLRAFIFLFTSTFAHSPSVVVVEQDASGYEVVHLNFARLLHRYTRAFAQTDAEEALHYLYLVCLNADLPGATGKEQVTLCHDYIRELVMDTRKYSQLLGDVRNDGTKIVRFPPRRFARVHELTFAFPRL